MIVISHTWLVATVLENTDLNDYKEYEFSKHQPNFTDEDIKNTGEHQYKRPPTIARTSSNAYTNVPFSYFILSSPYFSESRVA